MKSNGPWGAGLRPEQNPTPPKKNLCPVSIMEHAHNTSTKEVQTGGLWSLGPAWATW
jgi:hypothetical protein